MMFGTTLATKLLASLTRTVPLVTPKISYKGLTGKDLENKIISDILSGDLIFIATTSLHTMCIEHHYTCMNSNIRIRVDDGGSMGSYNFLYIDDCDYSYALQSEFDYSRVVRTVQTGVDPGPYKPRTDFSYASVMNDLMNC